MTPTTATTERLAGETGRASNSARASSDDDRTTGDSDREADSDDAEDSPLVSVVIATYNRSRDLVAAVESALDQRYRPIEVVIVSNSDGSDAAREARLFGDDSEVEGDAGGGDRDSDAPDRNCDTPDSDRDDIADADRFTGEPVRYVHFPERVGVPEARNVGYEHADGEYLVTIDDDAVLADRDAVDQVVETFRDHEDVAALAFESRSYDTGEKRLKEIPMRPEFRRPPNVEIEVSAFCGVGNALRRDVVMDLGGFAGGFVYAFEEQDLSIRLRNAGYDIRYVPSVAVRHKVSDDGRLPSTETRTRRIENRIKITLRNLPVRYVVFTILLWSVCGPVVMGLSPMAIVKMYRRLYEQRTELLSERSVVDAETIDHLRNDSGMLFAWWYGPNPLRVLAEPHRLRW